MWNKYKNRFKYTALAVIVTALSAFAIYKVYHNSIIKKEDTTIEKSEISTLTEDNISKDNGNENTDSKENEIKSEGINEGVNEKINDNQSDKNIKEKNPKTFDMSKLENDINNLIKNERGIYSIAYQRVDSSNKLIINSKKMQSASIIKVFIMVEVFNEIKEGRIKDTSGVKLSNSMKVGGTGSLASRKEGTIITINELIKLMITESDNTATNILIDIVSMGRVNELSKKLGCFDTILQRKMMDFKAMDNGYDNYTSVSDLCNVLNKIYKGECIDKGYDQRMIDIMKEQKNNSKIPLLLPNGTVVAHKTGELDKAENDAGIIFVKDRDYILCILSNDIEPVRARNVISKISKVVYDFNGTDK